MQTRTPRASPDPGVVTGLGCADADQSWRHRSPSASVSAPGSGVSRRRLVTTSAALVGAATAVSACSSTAAPADPALVRLTSVTTVRDGGLYDALLPEFEARSGYRVALAVAEDVYGPARGGQADVVLSHYGHKDVDAFVLGGFGRWPHTVLFNQLALIGPTGDPARVQGLGDLVAAFARLAAARAPFVVNNAEGLDYLTQSTALAAGLAPTGGMFDNDAQQGGPVMDRAAARGGYTLWGLTPFLRYTQGKPLPLRPVLLADPALQRIMVTVVVNPDKVGGVNAAGASALQDYLLAPATQARIRTHRLPGIDQPVFWPAGRNNQSSFLPTLTTPAPTSPAVPRLGPGGGTGGGGGSGGGSGGGGGPGHGPGPP